VSDNLSIHDGLKQADDLLPQLPNFALAYAARKTTKKTPWRPPHMLQERSKKAEGTEIK
jgi:hypothetical protein